MKKLLLFLIFLFSLTITKNYAQMPPHPDLLEKIKLGKVEVPYAISNLDLIRSKGVDAPWSSQKPQMLKKQDALSRSLGPGLVPSGSWKALAILVEFSDNQSQVDADYFDNLLFGQSTGTLRDYYNKVSYGNLDIVTVNLPGTIGWVTAPQTYSYYVNGQNGLGSYPQNSKKLVEDIVSLVDPVIDFSQYDNDGDGDVDALFIVHSGRGAEYTGQDNDIWSHSGGTIAPPNLDGVRIYRYSIEPEYWYNPNPGDMTCGVFAHEMGHSVFGLPDLYDTDNSSHGLGNWSLMANGVWNGNNGSSPAFPDAWTHIQMGYITPSIVSSNITGQAINNVENTPEAYLLQNTLCGTEYFLVENRQQIGYDTYLPGSGLCIYHIDNTVNNNRNEWYPGHISSGHYRVALEQADGLWELERSGHPPGNAGDIFPGSINNKNFRTLTVPNSRTYSFSETGIGVSNISSSSLVMSADFKVDTQPDTENLVPQFTEEFFVSLAGISDGSVAWGDYDNDGYLDILLTGLNKQILFVSDTYVSRIYHNNGDDTFTEQTSISLTDVSYSSAAWGDFDNDSYLDILLTGKTVSGTPVSKVYHNNGNNTFTEETSISLTGVYESSVAWGDYDNDGYSDILLTGRASDNYVSKIYRNNRDNTFTEQASISLTGVGYSSVAWGDYNNDGYLDILLTGRNSSGSFSKIYRNNGDNTFTEQTSISLSGVSDGSASWGDYNNDGYSDILLTGQCSPSKIYRNNGNNTFTAQTSISLIARCVSVTTWGDYDNDGYLDILSIGQGGTPKIYHNNKNNTFSEQNTISLFNVSSCSSAWGDNDNDGDLDILLAGSYGIFSLNKISIIYNNNNTIVNTLATIPSNLKTVVNGNDVTFSWDKSTDNETPQNGLTYNLAIGTSPGGIDILSPMSDRNTGYRRIVNLGNTNHCNSWTIKGLPEGQYYWSVQAIDNCFAGSAFAVTKNFMIQSPGTIVITYPAGGEVFEPGSNPIITYSSLENSGYVNLDYSTDGGIIWNAIAANQLDDGDYSGWVVPNTPSTNCKIRVIDVDGDPSATSNGFFTIFSAQFTEQTSISLIGIVNSSVDLGDYDNDGDLDILLTGDVPYGDFVSKIYRNNGDNSFSEQTLISLIGLKFGAAAWGDYDNDRDLDILLTGQNNDDYLPISKIYKNNGDGTFTEQTSISLVGVFYSSVNWGDYDSDGYLDILLTGFNGNTRISKIYKNGGDGTFTEQASISLTGVLQSSTAWGDYNNDGHLDILLTGRTSGSGRVSKIYKNNGDGTFTEQTSINLIGVLSSSVAWGDYNNDGHLDILLTGSTSSGEVSKIYKNNGDGTFIEQISISLAGVSDGSAAWGDYNNDGHLDILLTGSTSSDRVSKIYKNNGDGTFTEQTLISLAGISDGSVAWGDYDNDNDLDILLTGSTPDFLPISKIYRNNNIIPNTPSTAPNNLQAVVNGNEVTFKWDKSTDNETPQNGLHYNLVIGTTPNGADKLSPMSDRTSGLRRVVRLGNSQINSWTIKNIPDGNYYWSVQAIDNCFTGSDFAPEQVVAVPLPVELTSFKANVQSSGVLLDWETATEINNYGFEIERRVSIQTSEVNLRPNLPDESHWYKIGFTEGNGNSNSPKRYGYKDKNPTGGSKFEYRLKQIDLDGTFDYSNTVEVMIIPSEYKLFQNYPNPFNPFTEIQYQIPQDGLVALKIYDILGNEVTTLVNEPRSIGRYTIRFDASDLASGTYVYHLKVNDFISTKKMILLK